MTAVSHESTVIFLHIPKTAGTTLHDIIDRQYNVSVMHTMVLTVPESIKQFLALSDAQRGQFEMIRGHSGFGLHKFVPRPCHYFTILRDPIERVISTYYFLKHTPNSLFYNIFKEENMSLKDYVEGGYSDMIDNGQTRMLAGGDGNILEGKCTKEMFEKAKENLRQSFTVVGLTERFDESLILLRRQYGWRRVFYARKNVAQGRLPKEKLSSDTLNAILTMNQFDIALYQFAQQLFEEQLQQYGLAFKVELFVFKMLNVVYSRIIVTSAGSYIANKIGELLARDE